MLKLEKELMVSLEQFGDIIQQAFSEHNPSLIAIYAFNLAKTFNSFYTKHSVIHAETEDKKQLRLELCMMTANIIRLAKVLLGIRVPGRMLV